MLIILIDKKIMERFELNENVALKCKISFPSV